MLQHLEAKPGQDGVHTVTLPRALRRRKNDHGHPSEFRFRVRAGDKGAVVLSPWTGDPVKDATGLDISAVKPGATAVFTPAIESTPHPQGSPLKDGEGRVMASPGQPVVAFWQRLEDVLPS